MGIPKIIHQIWIGSKPKPTKFMDTWKNKHKDFEYISWTEEEIEKRKIIFKCQHKIHEVEEFAGKTDIMRLEILYKYGGIYLDADSICVEKIDDELLNTKCFAAWEQEEVRPGLIANGSMGFPPKHPLVKACIDWIMHNEVSTKKTQFKAWINVGPGLLTRMYNTDKFKDLHIFPSYTFTPIHHTGLEYKGHGKVYAYQEWGSTHKTYNIMNNIILPAQFITPPVKKSVSILLSSYNTNLEYIKECLDSIKAQVGHFNMELVWIDDGSNKINSNLVKNYLNHFEKITRFTKVIYHKNQTNKGIGYSLNKGVHLCSNEIIVKMDSDDIMVNNRIENQLNFMLKHPKIMICGGAVNYFKENIHKIIENKAHPSITWNQYKKETSYWFANHPTLCYRKSAILKIGNYDKNKRKYEDFDMQLRMLKKYGYIYNFNIPFLYYRIHNNQTTHELKNSTVRADIHNELDKIITREINSEEINDKNHISSKKHSLARKHSLTKKHRKI